MVAGLYCVLAAGCGSDGYAPDEHENLTPNEMQTFLREELGTTARIDQTHGDDTVTLLMTEHFDRWVYAKGWNPTGPVPDKIGDLVNPVPGAKAFGPWHSYHLDFAPDDGYHEVALTFRRRLVLRYLLNSKKVDRPDEAPVPEWRDEVVDKLGDLTGTSLSF